MPSGSGSLFLGPMCQSIRLRHCTLLLLVMRRIIPLLAMCISMRLAWCLRVAVGLREVWELGWSTGENRLILYVALIHVINCLFHTFFPIMSICPKLKGNIQRFQTVSNRYSWVLFGSRAMFDLYIFPLPPVLAQILGSNCWLSILRSIIWTGNEHQLQNLLSFKSQYA